VEFLVELHKINNNITVIDLENKKST